MIFKNITMSCRIRIYSKNGKKQLQKIIFNPPIRLTDSSEELKLIKEYHTSTHGGHNGVKRTINRIKQRFVWRNVSKMAKEFDKKCEKCSKNKTTRHIKESLVITETPGKTFEVISIDTIIGPLFPSIQYRYIVTAQCELTKYIEAFPFESKDAISVAKDIVNNFVLRYGNFKTLGNGIHKYGIKKCL